MPSPVPHELVVIEAPSSLGLRPLREHHIPGARFMSQALLQAGLLEEIPLAAHLRLPEPPYRFEPDPSTGIFNFSALIDFTRLLEATVGAALRERHKPLIIGGDCSVLLGAAVALKRLGRYSLLHVDSHNDFGHGDKAGKAYPTAAGADLALVTGRGHPALTDLDHLGPYFRDEDVYQLGEHAEVDDPDYQPPDFPRTAIHRFPLRTVRRDGIDRALAQLSSMLTNGSTDGFWLHLDLDVVDAALMPAVDSPESPGFTWEELEAVLRLALSHPKWMGMNLTIFDPELDPTGKYAAKIAATLRAGLLLRGKKDLR